MGDDPSRGPRADRTITDAAHWEYFGEGANNILYRYVAAEDRYFQPFLLRLRKLLPGAPTTFELHTHLYACFGPLLPTYMMRTELIALGAGVVSELNAVLAASEGEEPADWAGRPIKTPKKRRLLDEKEPWGLLVEDMSCGNYLYPRTGEGEGEGGDDDEPVDRDEEWKDMAMIEFKPKWLTQSPNAPANWRLCRTCAVRAMQNAALRARKSKGKPNATDKDNDVNMEDDDDASSASDEEKNLDFCPLDLSSKDPTRIEHAVLSIVNLENAVMIADPGDPDDETALAPGASTVDQELATSLANSLVTLLTNFFRTSSIIPTLTALQSRFGSRGVFTSATLALLNESDPLPSESELITAALRTGERIAGTPTATRRGTLDPEGVGFGGDIGSEGDIWTAMTLRDCSLFLKIWVRRRRGRGMEARVECKVGDLDLKGGEGGRAVYWRDVERRLRGGGWYRGKEVRRSCRTGKVEVIP